MTYLISFYSVSSALLTNKTLQAKKIKSIVVPVPRVISSSCGYAVEVESEKELPLIRMLEEEGEEWEHLYQIGREGKNTTYHQIG